MVAAILLDKKKILPCAVRLEGEYGVDGLFVGVPVKLGRGGVEQVVELDLTAEEKALFEKSVAAVRGLGAELPPGHALPAGPRYPGLPWPPFGRGSWLRGCWTAVARPNGGQGRPGYHGLLPPYGCGDLRPPVHKRRPEDYCLVR